MNDMSPAAIGHNNPPDPLDEAVAQYETDREEAESWLDGKSVENEPQMLAVDSLTATMKEARKAIEEAKEGEYRPFKAKCDAVVAKYKPTLEDQDRIVKGLVAVVAPFKAKLAEQKAAEERAAWEETNRLRREAEAKAAQANAADIEAQREVAAARQAAMDSENAAKATAKSAPKGMRTVHRHEVTDVRALVRWIAINDKDSMGAFATEYARQNHRTQGMDGVRTWTAKEAF